LSVILLVVSISTIYTINEFTNTAVKEMNYTLKSQALSADIILNNEIDILKEINNSISKDNSLKTLFSFAMTEQISVYFQDIKEKFNQISNVVVFGNNDNILFSYTEDHEAMTKIYQNIKNTKSGIVLINDKDINIYSFQQTLDKDDKPLATVLILEDVSNSLSIPEKVSTKLNTYTFLYQNNELVAMCDTEGKKHMPENNEKNITLKDYKMDNQDFYLSNAISLFHDNYYIYGKSLMDNAGKTVGFLAVGNTDKQIKATKTKIFINMISLGIVFCLLGLLLTWVFAVILTNPIKSLLGNIKLIQNGDLTVEAKIHGNDEITDLSIGFNKMVYDIKNMVHMIVEQSDYISEINSKFADTFRNIVSDMAGINEQMSSIENNTTDSSAVVQEVTASVIDMSSESYSISGISSMGVDKSQEIINKTNNVFSQFETVKENANQVLIEAVGLVDSISEMQNISSKVVRVVKVINDIADNSSLLSLNASIEAARAGEQGRGFAVVASEVRKLSNKTKEQSGMVIQLNQEIVQAVDKIALKLNDNSDKVQNSFSVVNKLETEFSNLVDFIRELNESMNTIADNIKKQATSSEQISSAMENISGNSVEIVTNVSNVTEVIRNEGNIVKDMMKNIDELEGEFMSLKHLVGKFKVN
jgi:methyl-accepting chemotaxis protein/calcineurin-like phosphoesterase family protein